MTKLQATISLSILMRRRRSFSGITGWKESPCLWHATLPASITVSPNRVAGYVSRMVNLTTFAPNIVAAVLDGSLPPEVPLFELAAGTPALWERQRVWVGGD